MCKIKTLPAPSHARPERALQQVDIRTMPDDLIDTSEPGQEAWVACFTFKRTHAVRTERSQFV